MDPILKKIAALALVVTASLFSRAQSSCTPTIVPTSTTVCPGFQTTLTAFGASSYTWLSSSNPATFVSQAVIVGPGLYTVVASSGTCTASASITIFSSPPLVISISASSQTLCAGDPATLTASGASSYTWTNGNSSSQQNPLIIFPTVSTTYSVTGSTAVCSGSATIGITVENCGATGISKVEAINDLLSVSPNPGKGLFFIAADVHDLLSLEVYDILGNLIQKTRLENGRAMLHLEDAPNGIYMVRVINNGQPVAYRKIVKN